MPVRSFSLANLFSLRRNGLKGRPSSLKTAESAFAQGDAARDRNDWAEAASSYRSGLKVQPAAAHIWIQLGHALKEQGFLDIAFVAYWRGLQLAPEIADSFLQMGICLKLLGRELEATNCFLRAVQLDPSQLQARLELSALGREENEVSRSMQADSFSALIGITPNDAQMRAHALWMETGVHPVEAEISAEPMQNNVVTQLARRADDTDEKVNNLAQQIARCLEHLSALRAQSVELTHQRSAMAGIEADFRDQIQVLSQRAVDRDEFDVFSLSLGSAASELSLQVSDLRHEAAGLASRVDKTDLVTSSLADQIAMCLAHLSNLRAQSVELAQQRISLDQFMAETRARTQEILYHSANRKEVEAKLSSLSQAVEQFSTQSQTNMDSQVSLERRISDLVALWATFDASRLEHYSTQTREIEGLRRQLESSSADMKAQVQELARQSTHIDELLDGRSHLEEALSKRPTSDELKGVLAQVEARILADYSLSREAEELRAVIDGALALRPTLSEVKDLVGQATKRGSEGLATVGDINQVRESLTRMITAYPSTEIVKEAIEQSTAALARLSDLDLIRAETEAKFAGNTLPATANGLSALELRLASLEDHISPVGDTLAKLLDGTLVQSAISAATDASLAAVQAALPIDDMRQQLAQQAASDQKWRLEVETDVSRLSHLQRTVAQLDQKFEAIKVELDRSRDSQTLDSEFQQILSKIREVSEESKKNTEETVNQVYQEVNALKRHYGARDADVKAMLGYLDGRLEFVRREILYEFQHGPRSGSTFAEATLIQPKIIAPEKVSEAQKSGLRLNLGCGHIPRQGYINADRRELPMVDIVCEADAIPLDPNSVVEISSSHLIEHFPQEELLRLVLPHWFNLLINGGRLHAVVPDGEAMIAEYAKGEYPFIDFREVLFGAQDYIGDFHYNLFTPDSLSILLNKSGFADVKILDRGRRNGKCYEFEIEAKKIVALAGPEARTASKKPRNKKAAPFE